MGVVKNPPNKQSPPPSRGARGFHVEHGGGNRVSPFPLIHGMTHLCVGRRPRQPALPSLPPIPTTHLALLKGQDVVPGGWGVAVNQLADPGALQGPRVREDRGSGGTRTVSTLNRLYLQPVSWHTAPTARPA